MSAQPDAKAPTDDVTLFLRDLSYDVAWKASASGVIHCCQVLNRRGDIFNAVEGHDLRAIHCEKRGKSAFDLLQEGKHVRHIEVRLAKTFGPERLYLTARPIPGGGAAGTFTAVDPRADDVLDSQLSLLSHISRARDREEGYRREAEIMLQGLRLLLQESTASKKLKDLSCLMADAIKGASPLVLQAGQDCVFRPLDPAAPPICGCEMLTEIFANQISPVTVHRDGGPYSAGLRKILGEARGDIALIFLPVSSESIVLICAARNGSGFQPEDVGLANRFALIMKQALVLKEEQDKLIQSAKLSALGQISACLAHELRQPLNTISVAAQNLELASENGAVAPEVLAAKIKRILCQVDRASQIMDRVRRFSRKSNGDFAAAGLLELAQGVQMLMEHALVAAGVTLEIDVPDRLSVRCDAVQIEQVLANLVRNAMDALSGIGSAHKTDNGTITIRGRETPQGIALRVEDNGPGFPEHVVDRPLDTFFTTKSAEAGTGLGLSICSMIARDHAGTLQHGNHAGGAYVELHLPERYDEKQ
jgi:signal transduction histidine kinase